MHFEWHEFRRFPVPDRKDDIMTRKQNKPVATTTSQSGSTISIVGIAIMAATLTPGAAGAQTLGAGGTMVNGNQLLEKCDRPIGTASLVEEKKAAGTEAGLPPQLAAMMAMARAQQGQTSIDPLPLLKLLAAQSGCFQVVDRGEAFNAIQRERQIAAGGQTTGAAPGATLTASDYVLVAQIVEQDGNAGGIGGLGGVGFGGLGFKQTRKEAQVLLTLSKVSTGVQEAVASGQARKKDTGLVMGGLLGLGVGAIGGGYESTDIGKVTAAALLDGFNKLVIQVRARPPVAAAGTSAVTSPATPAAPVATSAVGGPPMNPANIAPAPQQR
jgi:curli biogenesis system outer membrane secretion channel CsgG